MVQVFFSSFYFLSYISEGEFDFQLQSRPLTDLASVSLM